MSLCLGPSAPNSTICPPATTGGSQSSQSKQAAKFADGSLFVFLLFADIKRLFQSYTAPPRASPKFRHPLGSRSRTLVLFVLPFPPLPPSSHSYAQFPRPPSASQFFKRTLKRIQGPIARLRLSVWLCRPLGPRLGRVAPFLVLALFSCGIDPSTKADRRSDLGSLLN